MKSNILYRISVALLNLSYRLTGGLICVDRHNVPETGGVILAPNHISYADPPAVGCGLRRQVHCMAKEELFRFPLGVWMRAVGAFPVRRGPADRKALKRAIQLLKEGRTVCIFPEGTRSPDGRLQAPELGISLVALRSRAPVVPVAVIGSDKVLPPHTLRPRRHRIRIVYGRPLTFPDLYEAGESRKALEEIGRRTMAAIADLLAKHAP